MLSWSISFFVIAIVAAVLGFSGIAGTATDLARITFYIFIVMFLISTLTGFARGKGPRSTR